MRNFFQFKKHMKKFLSINLSLLLISFLLLCSCVNNKKKINNYNKEENLRTDTIKYESIKIQTH